ncbi:AraC family transcriptional regulator [Pricia sp.]|uniref:AraC family transcriptional regulator n=1 Tax=Pricia sp. TaxID=2268138 RepID=UPI003594575E
MLYFSGIVIGIFLSLVLLSKKGKTQADMILLIWILVTTLTLLLYYLHITEIQYQYPFILGIGFPLPLFQGPLLFLYTTALTPGKPLKAINLLHFLPVVFSYLLFSDFLLLSHEAKIAIFKNDGAGYEVFTTINLMLIVFSGVIYTILSLYKLRTYKKALKNEFSYTEKINLNWLQYLILGISLIWLVIIFSDDEKYTYIVVVFFMAFMGYFGIKQVGVFSQNIGLFAFDEEQLLPINDAEYIDAQERINEFTKESEVIQVRAIESSIKVNYEKSALSSEAANDIYNELTSVMRTNKPYKDAELTLSDLAQMIEVHPNYLSQVINTKEEKNFYDFINDH